jgi:hypothetical protein
MRAHSGELLLGLPVRLRDLEVGRPVELLLDHDSLRAVGLDVLCRDETHRFLPFPAARIDDESITIPSPLMLLEEHELDFYRSRTLALSALRGRTVSWKRRALGTLRDAVFAANGDLLDVVIDTGDELARIPFDASLELTPESRSAA